MGVGSSEEAIQSSIHPVQAIFDGISALQDDKHIFTKQTWQMILKDINSHYFTNQQRQSLLQMLVEYLKYSKMSQSRQKLRIWKQMKKNMQKLGQNYHKNINQIHFNHLKATKIIQKLFSNKKDATNLNLLTYNIQDKQQILLVSKIVKECCEQDLNAFFFLSNYLVQCCIKKASQESFPITDLECQLQEILNFLRKQHPPNDKTLTGNISIKVQQNKKIQHSLILDLKNVEPQRRNERLQQFIIEVAQRAKNNYENLVDITKGPCNTNNGTGYKVGLKVKDQKNKSSIDRVKQKLFSKNFRKYQIPLTQKNLKQCLVNEISHYHQSMVRIFEQTIDDVKFTVSDMLRGKCMFQEMYDLKKAAQDIIEKITEKGYSFQIDNRLGGNTTDLVFKIKIDEIVTEFQLAYKFNVVKNEFNHKIYELTRSKFFSVLNTLFIFNEKSHDFLKEIMARIKILDEKNLEVRIKLFQEQKLEPISQLREKFSTFLKSKNIIIKKQQTQIKDEEIDGKIAEIKQIMQALNQSTQTINLAEKLYLNGMFLKNYNKTSTAIKYYKRAKNQLKQSMIKPSDIIQFDRQLDKETANSFRESGNINQALKWCLNIVSHQEQKNGSSLCNIGLLYHNKGQDDEAMRYYQKSLQVYKKDGEEDTIGCAVTLSNIGQVYRQKGIYTEALKYYEKALKIQQQSKGQDSIECAITFGNIGNLFEKHGNYNNALRYFEKSLQIIQKIKGQESINCVTPLNNIGLIYSSQGHYSQALKYYQKCLKIQQKTKGQKSLQCSITMSNIGNLFDKIGNSQLALKYYERSLNITAKIKGEQSIDCVAALVNVGSIYCSQGEFSQALTYYQKSLKIIQRVKGQNCYQCAVILSNIGSVYCQQQKFEEALDYYSRSLKITQQIMGKESIKCTVTLNNIGSVYCSQKKYSEALSYYKRSLEIIVKVMGQDSINCNVILSNIGSVYYQQKQYPQAIEYYLKSLRISEKVLGKDSLECAVVLKSIGEAYQYQQKYNQALENYSRCLEIRQRILGPEHGLVISIQNIIGRVQSKMQE